jgi:O-antigen/teichoic acid export membrane protein
LATGVQAVVGPTIRPDGVLTARPNPLTVGGRPPPVTITPLSFSRRRHGTRTESSLARNSVAGTLPIFVGYGASFISAPIVLTGLGLTDFGIWALTGGFAQYGSLFDFGLGRSMSRFIAIHDARDEQRAIAEVVGVGLIASLVIALALVGVAVALAGPVAGAVGHIDTRNMRIVLISSALMVGTAMLSRALIGWPTGLRRMTVPNVASAIGALVNFVLSVGVILAGGHLVAYALANALASGIALVIVAACIFWYEGLPPIAMPRRSLIREMLVFSVRQQVVALGELIDFQTDKIIIAFTVGPAAAGAYEIANRACFAARSVGVYAQAAMVPKFAADLVTHGPAAMTARYGQMAQRAAAVSFPGLFFCAGCAPLLMPAWLGEIPSRSVAIVIVLSLAYVIDVSSGVTFAMAAAGNAIKLPARTTAATVVINLALTAGLAPVLGVWGVLAGTFIALTIGAIAQIHLVQRHFGIDPRTHWRSILRPVVVSALLAVEVAVVDIQFTHGFPRVVEALVVIGTALLFGIQYVLIGARLDFLPHSISRRLPTQLTPARGAAGV